MYLRLKIVLFYIVLLKTSPRKVCEACAKTEIILILLRFQHCRSP